MTFLFGMFTFVLTNSKGQGQGRGQGHAHFQTVTGRANITIAPNITAQVSFRLP